MKRLTLLLHLFCPILLYSQQKNEIPAFGDVTKAELQMTGCDFDKNAEAMVLFDVENAECAYYTYSVSTKIKRHIRLKILNDKGLDEANIKIPYVNYQGDESIGNITAQTYNLDASGNIVITRLDKKGVFDKKINKMLSEKIFTFPEVKAGSILEYAYTVTGTVGAALRNWNFQRAIPVKLSRYTIDFPTEIEVNSEAIAVLPVDRQYKRESGREIKTFTMKEIPALRDEPFITCEDDYLQRVESRVIALNTSQQRIPLTTTWPQVINSLMEDMDFGVQLTKSIPRTDDLEAVLKNITDPYQKMSCIYRYVRKNMEWNGQSNIWALNGVKSAWKDKKGTAGEINLILINLLKDANLEVHPILVSTRENGVINTMHAGYGQFDKVMAYVKIKEKVYVLDATDKYGSPDIIPWEVMCSEGLVIEKMETRQWGWRQLWDEKHAFRDFIIINASIDGKGTMHGAANISHFDYSRAKQLQELKAGKDKFVEKYFTSLNPGLKVDSFTVENEDVDSLSLVENFQFSQPLSSSGDYMYFSLNLFTGLEKNPFVADTRFSDIVFGARQNATILESFEIPEGYSLDELPKNVRMRMPDSSIIFTRIIESDTAQLRVRIDLQFRKPIFAVEEYDRFHEFYKRLFDLLNEQIVVKKKPQT